MFEINEDLNVSMMLKMEKKKEIHTMLGCPVCMVIIGGGVCLNLLMGSILEVSLIRQWIFCMATEKQ